MWAGSDSMACGRSGRVVEVECVWWDRGLWQADGVVVSAAVARVVGRGLSGGLLLRALLLLVLGRCRACLVLTWS